MAKTITKEFLQELGLTVTEDGRIFKGEVELKQINRGVPHPRGNVKCYYKYVQVYNPALYKIDGTGMEQLGVSRCVWAWFNGICPGELDVDHINDDKSDNRLENLQLKDRKGNNERKKRQCNQYTAGWTDAEYEYYKDQKASYKREIKRLRNVWTEAQEDLKDLTEDYKCEIKHCTTDWEYDFTKRHYKEKKEMLERTINQYKSF